MGEHTHYIFRQYSRICLDGDGVGCDEYCSCPCHGQFAPNFLTNDEVREWHRH